MNESDKPSGGDATAAGARPQKPAGQTWESFADSLITRAQRDGVFDNLPGAGKPIPDLDAPHDPMWWARRLVQRENLAFAPGHLELHRRVERELEQIWSEASEAGVRRRLRSLNTEIRRANAGHVSGPVSTLAPLNEDDVVQRWRARQGRRVDPPT